MRDVAVPLHDGSEIHARGPANISKSGNMAISVHAGIGAWGRQDGLGKLGSKCSAVLAGTSPWAKIAVLTGVPTIPCMIVSMGLRCFLPAFNDTRISIFGSQLHS
jgi:hypothetical protein